MNQEQEITKTINEQKEWQEYQYDPGHWLGGNIPPYLLRKNKKLGVVLLIIGFMGLVLSAISFSFQDFDLSSILPFLIALLTLFAGYSKLKGN